jgi:hypothetical protein
MIRLFFHYLNNSFVRQREVVRDGWPTLAGPLQGGSNQAAFHHLGKSFDVFNFPTVSFGEEIKL